MAAFTPLGRAKLGFWEPIDLLAHHTAGPSHCGPITVLAYRSAGLSQCGLIAVNARQRPLVQ